ncbi:MAG: putative hydrolase of the superfamily [Solirubrobacteraceae bacterium]|nr:putative hydrolase of the superfamily [Solirubrobacteraceae bacterium]
MPSLRAIVFDLDDTLYLEEDYVHSGFRAVSEWGAEHLHIPASQGYFELDALFRDGVRGDTFDRWISRHGVDSDGVVSELVRVYREHVPSIEPLAAAPVLLERLGGRYRLGLLSDGYEAVQNAKLDALGLRDAFAAVLITDELGRDAWKPSPRGFEVLMERLGIPPAEAAYVSDNPAKDFVAARDAGLRSVRVRHDHGIYADLRPETARHAPDLEADGLDEVEEALARLEAR